MYCELGIDVETYSSVDIDSGAYAYTASPDFEILLVGYKFSDEDEVHVIDMTAGEAEEHPKFWKALTDPSVIKTAYNANFERQCFARHTGRAMPAEEWRCTMILSVQLGLPRSLSAVGEALGLPEEELKKKTGKALIQYFCKPCKPTRANGGRTRNLPEHAPEKWELFKEYNKGDVVTEQSVLARLKDHRPDESEQELWTLDQEINDRGVLLDTDLAAKIVRFDERRSEELVEEAKRITRLENPNSLAQLKPWLQACGLPVVSLTKDDVTDMLSQDRPMVTPAVRRVLEIRQALGMTSINKYRTMLEVAGSDGRARGILQFYGGRTGRWAGKSLQPQNLVRNSMPDAELDACRDLCKMGDFESLEMLFGEPSGILSQLVRTAFVPSPGCRFVVTDFSAIEARVIAWIAGEDWRLEVFRNGGDIYCESASRIYHVPVAKHGPNAELRQRGKIAELALGYNGGVGAMKAMDTSGTVPEDEMSEIIRQWRTESPNIVKMWKDCQNAAVAVISGKAPRKTLQHLQGTSFYMDTVDDTHVLFIRLPSGRPIAYWDPKVEDSDYGPRISYMAQNQTTRKWERIDTYGGKLTENIVQSVARDCLAEKMKAVNAEGYNIVFHVHDEMIVDAPREDTQAADRIDRIMAEPIDWAPGLPLKGGTYECDFYRKD